MHALQQPRRQQQQPFHAAKTGARLQGLKCSRCRSCRRPYSRVAAVCEREHKPVAGAYVADAASLGGAYSAVTRAAAVVVVLLLHPYVAAAAAVLIRAVHADAYVWGTVAAANDAAVRCSACAAAPAEQQSTRGPKTAAVLPTPPFAEQRQRRRWRLWEDNLCWFVFLS